MPSTNWVVRIFKAWGTRDLDRAWTNTYELVTGTALAPTDLMPAADTLVAAEKALHTDAAQFIQYTISTWENEPGSYDPSSFVTVSTSGIGSRTIGANEALDSNVTLTVQFTAATGRQGRRFYRGVLFESDVNANANGRFAILTNSTIADTGTVMVAFRNALAPLLPGGAGIAKLFLLGKGTTFPTTARPVTGVHTGTVTTNRRNHRYFNRITAFG